MLIQFFTLWHLSICTRVFPLTFPPSMWRRVDLSMTSGRQTRGKRLTGRGGRLRGGGAAWSLCIQTSSRWTQRKARSDIMILCSRSWINRARTPTIPGSGWHPTQGFRQVTTMMLFKVSSRLFLLFSSKRFRISVRPPRTTVPPARRGRRGRGVCQECPASGARWVPSDLRVTRGPGDTGGPQGLQGHRQVKLS